MRAPARLFVMALLLAGCAAAPPAAPPPAAGRQAFTGEVWTWDAQASTVTLRQGERTVRVTVTPEQLRGLQLHQVVTLYGEPAPPGIEQVVLPPGRLVPRGPADQAELHGMVAAIEAIGAVTVKASPGTLRLWLAEPGSRPYQEGQEVRVQMRVQPLDIVPATEAPAAAPAPEVGTEAGDYAVVQGRVTAVDVIGRLTVESPRGPVTVWLPGAGRYREGDWVEVRTSVHPGP